MFKRSLISAVLKPQLLGSILAFIRVIRGLNFGCGGAALGYPWLSFIGPAFPGVQSGVASFVSRLGAGLDVGGGGGRDVVDE